MPKAFILLSTPSDILISVMFGLIRSFDRYADVIGLLLSQFGQFDADALQVEAGNFFVQTFRQAVDTYFVRHCPQIHLGQDLICEGVAHYERRMACRATQVHQAAFCQQEDRVACRECVLVNLRFDVGVLDVRIVHQLVDLDFVVEMADVANDGLVFHLGHMFDGDDVAVTGGRNENVALTASSIVVTSKPSMAACRAQIGSISVIRTRAP